MALDWQSFLDSYNVHYVTKGANVARGHVSVKCPFCGSDDPSEHMTIHLGGNGWRCYRQHAHRGVKPQRLVAALLGVTYGEADRICGGSIFIPEDFLGAVRDKLAPAPEARRSRLHLPRDFRPLDESKPSARPFVNYLLDRGFTRKEIGRMNERHGLCYAVQGPYRGRVIFPVWHMGELQTWTARAISPDTELRYKTLSVTENDYDEAPAHGAINDYLLWFDDLVDGGDALCLVEGPFDALKVRTLGRAHGIFATCCFTAQPSASQMDLLYDLVDLFRHRYLLLDEGTLGTTLRVAQDLAALRIKPVYLPKHLKDPGELGEPEDLLKILGRERN